MVMSDSEGEAYICDRDICLKAQDLSTRLFPGTRFEDQIASKIAIVGSIVGWWKVAAHFLYSISLESN